LLPIGSTFLIDLNRVHKTPGGLRRTAYIDPPGGLRRTASIGPEFSWCLHKQLRIDQPLTKAFWPSSRRMIRIGSIPKTMPCVRVNMQLACNASFLVLQVQLGHPKRDIVAILRS
jgi:hypothetical protein